MAFPICLRAQAKYLGNAIFADLKQEAELGQRAAYLADLQRRAGEERDLAALAKILQDRCFRAKIWFRSGGRRVTRDSKARRIYRVSPPCYYWLVHDFSATV